MTVCGQFEPVPINLDSLSVARPSFVQWIEILRVKFCLIRNVTEALQNSVFLYFVADISASIVGMSEFRRALTLSLTDFPDQ